MLVSTKGRYALRVMVDLAENSKGGFTPLKEIARRQQISEKYLENILPTLVQSRFLTGARGRGGGYKLTRDAETYTVRSILELLEGSLAPVACLQDSEIRCNLASECRTLAMWRNLQTIINEYFEGITLADLCIDKRENFDFVI